MKNVCCFVLAAVLSAGLFGCSQAPVAVEPPPVVLKDFSMDKLEKPIVFTSAQDATTQCDATLAKIEILKGNILNVTGEHTVGNTLAPMNDIFVLFERMFGISELMANVHPDETLRQASEACSIKLSAAHTDLLMSPELYAAIKAVKLDNLDAATKRFVKLLTRDYERAGVDKDPETRARLAKINEEITEIGLNFDRNIRDSRKVLKVKPEQLAGLPEDFIAAHPADAEGLVSLSTDSTDYVPVLTYCSSETVRRELTQLYTQRAYPENEVLLKQLLERRAEFAKLVGFDTWASYSMADKMAKTPNTVSSFIANIADASRPRMEADIKLILERKQKEDPSATDFYPWDRFYYTEKLKKENHNVDSQEVRQFFAYDKVKRGVLGIASQLYGITFQQSDMDVWSPLVEAYDVYEGDKVIARFFLDMHPRENKYNHAAAFPMLSGIEGLQLPAGTLVCNFPEPSPSNPGYMEHSEVQTFFHEFGHLMHHLLANKHQWANQSGIACEWDFVETPSQLFEEWAWDYDVLKYFAVNANQEVISPELVKRMKDADSVGLGVHNMRQIYYASLSLAYHTQNPTNLDIVSLQNQLQAKYSPFKAYDADYTFASFGHLNGYNSNYYTYMWSLAIAKDFATKFKANGLMNNETAKLYREKVLAVGGAKDAEDMIRDFLGRDYNLDAFKKWLSE